MKLRLFKVNDRIVQAPPRARAAKVITGLFLAGMVAAFLAAMGVVDYQSRAVGWNQHRQEFAVSFTEDEARVTVFGASGTFALQPAYRAAAYVRRYQQGVDTLKPAPVWLAEGAGTALLRAQGWRVQRAALSLWDAAQKLPPLPKLW